MIFDRIENLDRYRALLPAIDEARRWLETRAATIAPGKHPLRGDELYASVSEETTRAATEIPFEAHRRYIDLQISLEGGERIDWASLGGLVPHPTRPAGSDVWFFESPPAFSSLLLLPGHFALFWPRDAHRPGVRLFEAAGRSRKVVFKVALPPAP